jgi:hypothetical protein
MEDRKQTHNFFIRSCFLSDPKSILKHSRPMGNSMSTENWERVLVKDLFDER